MTLKFIIDSNGDNFKNVKNVKSTSELSISVIVQDVFVVLGQVESSLKILQHWQSGEHTTQSSKRSREESKEISSMGNSRDHHGRQVAKRLKMIRSSETSTNALGTRL